MPIWAAIIITTGISAIIASTSVDTDPRKGAARSTLPHRTPSRRSGPVRTPLLPQSRRAGAGIRAGVKTKCGFPLIGESARTAQGVGYLKDGLRLGKLAKGVSILLLPVALAA